MTNIAGMTACGKRGGPNFLETIRVDSQTKRCPRGTVPCSNYSDSTDTVCVEKDMTDECPIIDILVIYSESMDYYKKLGYQVTSKGWLSSQESTNSQESDDSYLTYLAFSKVKARVEVGYSAVISTTINTQEPCYGQDRDRLLLLKTRENVSQIHDITIPIERDTPLSECPEYEWRLNSDDQDRFFTIGF